MLKFWSNITLLLQILIVIAVVLLLAYFDPFGIFGSKKQKLENTPVSVQSIREIDQLISAEYYGEVLTSLQEALIEDIRESAVSDRKEFESLRKQYEDALLDFHEKRNNVRLGFLRRSNKLYDLFYQEYSLLTGHPFYQVFIEVTLDNIKYKNERRLLKAIYKMEPDELNTLTAKISAIALDKYLVSNKNQEKIFTADKKQRKRQIVVLGRGSVKAGIDFQHFTEKNFRFDRDRKIIHLIGMKPKILTSDINPWFIPEKKVKGFEIILMTRKASKPAYMLKVKERALRKLRQKAIQANIVKQAKVNAERNLLSFFSLLVPEGVNSVIIHDDFLSYFDKTFLSDSVTTDIMRSVDSLMIRRYE
ncbi:MAG: DUF4230 domain-containing protein, partial [Cyclobacteriaceae bacterium]